MRSGAKAANTLLPSRGGMGIRLNTKSTRFISTAWTKISAESVVTSPSLSGIAKSIARPRLDSGPARETNAIPLFGLRRLLKFTGTGFAAPSITGLPTNIKKSGSNTEPNGSICGNGFKVIRPSTRAVSSPSFSATTPCMTSCTIAEKRRITS